MLFLRIFANTLWTALACFENLTEQVNVEPIKIVWRANLSMVESLHIKDCIDSFSIEINNKSKDYAIFYQNQLINVCICGIIKETISSCISIQRGVV